MTIDESGDYCTSLGSQYGFSGWNKDESPVESFDRGEWLKCLHSCMLVASFHPDPKLFLQDDQVLHELVHLISGIDISTHSNMEFLRAQVVELEEFFKKICSLKPEYGHGPGC